MFHGEHETQNRSRQRPVIGDILKQNEVQQYGQHVGQQIATFTHVLLKTNISFTGVRFLRVCMHICRDIVNSSGSKRR